MSYEGTVWGGSQLGVQVAGDLLGATHMALLLSVAVLGLVGSAHGWVTVSPQGRVTIKAETQIGCATIVLAAFGESLDAQHAGQLRGACLPCCLQALGTSRGGRPPKVAVCHRRRKRWARPK